jgi:hypothetical protein
MGLALFAPMLERVQQLRIQTRQASQVLGVHLIRLALIGIDEPQFASIGHQHLVAAFLEHPANPWRVSTRLYGDAHRRLLRSETPPQSLGSGTQPTFLHNLTALLIDEAEIGVFVAYVQSGCHLRLLFASIHGGLILLSGPLEPVEHLQTQRVLRRGVGLLISSSQNSVTTKFAELYSYEVE